MRPANRNHQHTVVGDVKEGVPARLAWSVHKGIQRVQSRAAAEGAVAHAFRRGRDDDTPQAQAVLKGIVLNALGTFGDVGPGQADTIAEGVFPDVD